MIRTAEKFVQYPGDKGTRYYKYVPSVGTSLGVVQFMHGKGQIGTDLAKVEETHLPKGLDVDGIRTGFELQLTVVAPQEEPGQEWWGRSLTAVKIAQSLNLGKPHYTGLSLGAMCIDNILNDMGDVFASVALVAGQFESSLENNSFERLKKIPTIFYYGNKDTVITGGYDSTKKMYERLKAAGADTTFIEYAGRGHDIWPESYTHYISWLMSKVGALTPPVDPPIPDKDKVIEQWIEGGKLHSKGASGNIVISN